MAPVIVHNDNGSRNGERRKLGITVFSGGVYIVLIDLWPWTGLKHILTGTAANSLVDVFNKIVEKRGCQLNYVIPISDNGGSSSELIRFVGGPSE
jgi:hypothetical protein